MKRRLPGDRLRAAAALLFDRDTVERVLEPALSDMQHEWLEATASGRRRDAALARLRGYAAFLRAALAVTAIEGKGRLAAVPLALVLPPLLLSLLGVLLIRAAVLPGDDRIASQSAAGVPAFYAMQAAYLAAGVLAMIAAAILPARRLARSSWVWGAIAASALLVALLAGVESDGARRWIALGGVLVIPGELITKPAFLLAAAGLLERRGARMRSLPALAALAALVIAPAAMQPDPVLIATLLAALGAMVVASGGSALARSSIAAACAAGALAAILALPGGGPTGGVEALEHRHTDFIIAVAVERAGAAGVLCIAALMAATLAGMRMAAARSGDALPRAMVAGASAMWLAQAAIHAAQAFGALPRTGAALPLVSYGGSSAVSFFVILGLIAASAAPQSPGLRATTSPA